MYWLYYTTYLLIILSQNSKNQEEINGTEDRTKAVENTEEREKTSNQLTTWSVNILTFNNSDSNNYRSI